MSTKVLSRKRSVLLINVTLNEIPVLFKFKLKDFPCHRFTINHTESKVIKIQDFSENYTCLLPNEVQSMHWTQATGYSVVVIRRVDGVLGEDNFVIISNDRNHDVPFVELSN